MRNKIVRRAVLNSVKRKYLDFVSDHEATAYRAWKHFRVEHPNVRENQVRQWLEKREEIEAKKGGSRVSGAGRRPISEAMEDILFDVIFETRTRKHMVTRSLTKRKALEIAKEMGMTNFQASTGWMRRFLLRHHLT